MLCDVTACRNVQPIDPKKERKKKKKFMAMYITTLHGIKENEN
jgi:hypothetical protein